MAQKLTTRALQERYSVTDRTIDRWLAAGILPPPMRINGRKYWDEKEIEERERERMAPREPSAA
jgi:DNA-binding transcriptional MerR regulator